MGRRRSNSKPIIAAILRQIDLFLKEVQVPDEENGAVPDLDLVWEWTSPDGSQRREVTRAEFEGGAAADGWPLPGKYRVYIADSNGDPDPRHEPWEAEHVDKDTLSGPKPEDTGGLMGALHGVTEEYRIILRDKKIELEASKRREKEAEQERRQAEEKLADAQRELASFKLAAERAKADKDYAEAKQKEAEEAYRDLERSVNAFEPQFKAGVDRVVEHFFPQFAPGNKDSEPESQRRVVAPPPGGDDSPERAKEVVDGTFEAIFTNIDAIRPLVEAGVIDWRTVRYVIWKYTGDDVGESVDWSHWEQGAEEEASDAG